VKEVKSFLRELEIIVNHDKIALHDLKGIIVIFHKGTLLLKSKEHILMGFCKLCEHSTAPLSKKGFTLVYKTTSLSPRPR
jgi:hypothetical protein